MTTDILKVIKRTNPIVHCITNSVTVNDCANALLALGASPVMAHHIAEVEEITEGSQSLVCNLGATDDYDAMFLAAGKASQCGHPIVVDPVGISGSTFRRTKLLELMHTTKVTCIRGNNSELRAILSNCGGRCGVDADVRDAADHEFAEQLQAFAAENHLILIASGKEDLVTDGSSLIRVTGGHEMMSKITGTGCMSSALLGAAFAAVPMMDAMNMTDAAVWLCSYVKRCGEQAAAATLNTCGGTMTFRQQFIDRIGRI